MEKIGKCSLYVTMLFALTVLIYVSTTTILRCVDLANVWVAKSSGVEL